jgi:hypothetical protein
MLMKKIFLSIFAFVCITNCMLAVFRADTMLVDVVYTNNTGKEITRLAVMTECGTSFIDVNIRPGNSYHFTQGIECGFDKEKVLREYELGVKVFDKGAIITTDLMDRTPTRVGVLRLADAISVVNLVSKYKVECIINESDLQLILLRKPWDIPNVKN